MSSTKKCAGCSSPSDSFAAAFNGVAITLCADCASRLLAGESKSDVIKTISLKEVA
jgi:hypothetical protein